MLCPVCGKDLPENARFCSGCGANLAEIAAVPAPVEQPVEAAPVEAAPVAAVPEAPAFQSSDFTPSDAVPPAPVSEQPFAPVSIGEQPAPVSIGEQPAPETKKKPKFGVKQIVAVAAAAAVLVGCVFGGVALFGGKNNKNAYVYMSDGNYMLLSGTKKNADSFEIASSKSDSTSYSSITFDEDGKYVYFYTKQEYNEETYRTVGTLNRAEIKKLGKNEKKNEKHITNISTKVISHLLVGKYVIYLKEDGDLCAFDGKNETKIDKDVTYLYSCDKSHFLYTTDKDELWGAEVKKLEEPVRLAKDVSSVYYYFEDPDNILITKPSEESEYDRDLYCVGFNKDEELIGENVNYFDYNTDEEVYYFTVNNGTSVSLYDYVIDDKKDADSKIKAPKEEDYQTTSYYYYTIGSYPSDESYYDELYTSCTEDLSLLGYYSMEEYVKRSSTTATMKTAIQSFINTYGSTANKDGYIKVTAEVKAALQKIHKASSYASNSKRWLSLCYEAYPYTTTDWDAYYDAYDIYNEAASRITLREQLQDEKSNKELKKLCSFKKGTVETIKDNIITHNSAGDCVVFNTSDMITEKKDITKISYYSDVSSLFTIDWSAQNYVFNRISGEINQLSEAAVDSLMDTVKDADSARFNFYVCNKDFYTNAYDDKGEPDAILKATADNGTIGEFKEEIQDATVIEVYDDVLYYGAEYYENKKGIGYIDLYSYKNGKETKLIEECNTDCQILIYEDGQILIAEDDNSDDDYIYELTLIDAKGNATVISDEATNFVRINKKEMLYVADEDLYCFNGKNHTRLASDVERLWVMNSLDYAYV